MYVQPWETAQTAPRGWGCSLRLLILVAVLLCAGCWSGSQALARVPPPPIDPASILPDLDPPKPGGDGKVDPVEQAKYDYERLTSAAAKAESRYKTLRRLSQEEAIDAQVKWITGIALIIAAVAGIAAFVVPIGKRIMVSVAVGGSVIAACAQAFLEAVPYLPWVGGILILAAGLWVAINWRKLSQTVQTASDHGDRLEQWLIADVFPHIDAESRILIENTIRDVKLESRQQAERLGVHNPLQYLRGKAPSLWHRLISKLG
jgi:membrane protein implicated in regulation of membrane protease activity